MFPVDTEEKDRLKFTGKGPVNSLVDIYIYSQPLVVTTKTDANGVYSYELSYHLPEGDHRAYTVIRQPETGLVRSEIFNFGVAYAQASEGEAIDMMVVEPSSKSRLKSYIWLAGIIILFGIGATMLLYGIRVGKAQQNNAGAEPNKFGYPGG